MGRHRREASRRHSSYESAGKRKKGTPEASPALGRHAAERATLHQRTAGSVPGVVGVIAILGAMGGAVLSDGNAAQTAGPTVKELSPAKVSASRARDDRGPVAVSRSADRRGSRAPANVASLVEQRDDALAEIDALADRYVREAERDRWILPMTSYRLTGTFGETSSLWASVHTGLDFAAPSGTPIRSLAGGVVTEAGWSGAYGYRTVIELLDGTEIWYCHQDRIGVDTGQTVERGQQIGTVGSTGNVTGPHLHLEVRPEGGGPVDPYAALAGHGTVP